MTFSHQEDFLIEANRYRILKVQTFPKTTVELYRQAFISNSDETYWIEIFNIIEGDLTWKTIAENQEIEALGANSLQACFDFLKLCAGRFNRHYPEPMVFRTAKKASSFSQQNCKSTLSLTTFGPTYP